MCTSSSRHCCRWEAKFGRAGKWQTSSLPLSLSPRMDKRHPRARMSAMKFPSHFQQPSNGGGGVSPQDDIQVLQRGRRAAPSISHSIIRDWARDVFVCHLPPQATPPRSSVRPSRQPRDGRTQQRDPRFGSLCRATTRPPGEASFSSGECRSGGHNMLQVDVVSGILLSTWQAKGESEKKPIFTVQFEHSGTPCNCTV